MTPQFTVTSCAAAEAVGDIAQVIASLPVSLQFGSERADLVGIDGGTPGWADEAASAVQDGVRGLMIINPRAADLTSLHARAEAAGLPVVIDATWTYNPAVADSQDAFAAHNDADSLLEARVNLPLGSDLEQVLLAQLSLIRTCVDPVVNLTFARKNARGYDALAELASGARAGITAILSDSVTPSASLRIVKPETTVELTVPGPAVAAPGRVVVLGPEGATMLTTRYETAHRAAWRHLHRLAAAGQASTDLAGFASDLLVLRNAG